MLGWDGGGLGRKWYACDGEVIAEGRVHASWWF